MARRLWTILSGLIRRLFGLIRPSGAARTGVAGAPTRSSAPTEIGAVPEWAAPLGTPERVDRLEAAIREEIVRRGMAAEYRDGLVTCEPGEPGSHQWAMSGLAARCAGAPETGWAAMVARHLETMARIGERERVLEQELKSYVNARSQLAPRLWDEQAAAELREHAVWREDIPGLLTVLSIDLPESIRTVSREMLEGWGVGEDQAFARAFDNLDVLTERKISPVELGDGQRLLAIEGPSYYTASLALKLDAIPELSGRHGAFVGMPTRHVLMCLPFDGPAAMQKLPRFLVAARAAEQLGPGPLSHRVYWYRAGKWSELPFEISPDSINLMTPPELTEYLQQLGEPGGGEDQGEEDGPRA